MSNKTPTESVETVALERPPGVKTRSTFTVDPEAVAAPVGESIRDTVKSASSARASNPVEQSPAPSATPAAKSGGSLPPLREQLLEAASEKITVQRAAEYGPAGQSFERIAALWTAREMHVTNRVYTAVDVAHMLALLKVARLAHQPSHGDSYEDLIGYAALGGELALGKERN